jgi:FtsP/CotA-like multicopper oxidase with cupredoxin domain
VKSADRNEMDIRGRCPPHRQPAEHHVMTASPTELLPVIVSRRALLAIGATAIAGSAARRLAWWEDVRQRPARSTSPNTYAPDVELILTASIGEAAILPGRPTAVWRYTGQVVTGPTSSLDPVPGSYLGPTLRLRRGQKVRVRFRNRLPDPSIVHWHGLDVPEKADGHPRLAVPGGSEYVYDFEVTNRAGTYWYHPHPHMQTGPQVYRGLAGLLIVSDDEESALALPSGAADLSCVLQDRRFDANNQLVYSSAMMDGVTGFLGDRVLVNGQSRPTWPLGTRAYRVRVLNGSNARIYKLAWSDGTPMTVIATDGGLLERPLTQRCVTLAPAQRVELWLDLSQRPVGTVLELLSEAFVASDGGVQMGGRGMGRGGMASREGTLPLGAASRLLTIEVAREDASAARLPERLSTFGRVWQPVPDAPLRRIPMTFQAMQWALAGRTFTMNDAAEDETVAAGSTHLWEFLNVGGPMGMPAAHPLHVHGTQFRVVSRVGGNITNSLREGLVDAGWTDTVLALPGETVRTQMTFTEHPGLYLYHCHILEHEDMGMMRNFRVVRA